MPDPCLFFPTDARWFTQEEILAVVSKGPSFTERDYKRLNEVVEGKGKNDADEAQEAAPKDEPPFRLPEPTAIAGALIRDWAQGKIRGSAFV
jgi:NAD+ diphosphatase